MTSRLLCVVFSGLVATSAFAQSTFSFANLHEYVTEDDVTLQITVFRGGSLAGSASVDYETVGYSARDGVDFVSDSGTLNFADQESQKNIPVVLLDDTESDLVNPRRVEVHLSSGVFTLINISDDEPPPPPLTMSPGNLTFSEGDGITNTYITFNLNRAHDKEIFVEHRSYQWSSDYNGARALMTGFILFSPGQTSIQVPVEIRGNDTYDAGGAQKSYHYELIGGPAVQVSSFDILLTEDDPQPTISISDVSVPEGSCAPTPIEITLTTNYPANGVVQWTAGDGTATQGDNDWGPYGVYYPVTFHNSTTAKITLVAPYGDLQIEDDETFVVTLTSATNMTIADDTATITIENDDEEEPSFLEDFVRIEAGQQSNLTINFPAPAPKGSVLLHSSDSRVKVPAAVAVPERAMSVSFAADATEAAGQVVITADLPGPLGATQLTATVDAFRDSDLHFEQPRRFTYAGETATASLEIDPPRAEEVTVTLEASAGIVAPESVVVPPAGKAEFPFTSLSAGRSRITATYGESSDELMIDIAAQQVKSFAPDVASTGGGTAVTLKGIGFSPGCGASFGSAAASTRFVDAQTLVATTPPHVAADVRVTVTCGATPVTATGEFRFAKARRRGSRH